MSLNDSLDRTLAWVARNLPGLRAPFTRALVNRYANAAPPRPHPHTLADPGYTSWTGLSDMSYSARHLPPCSDTYHASLPAEEAVVPLFLRPGSTREAKDTTLLFPFFAQWFTDSFLRMDADDYRRNQSNHGIDLIQIYGMHREQTRMLRKPPTDGERGMLDYRLDAHGQMWGVPLFEEGPDGKPVLRERFAERCDRDETDGHCTIHPGLYTHANYKRVFVDGSRMTDTQRRHAVAVGLEHGNSTVGNTLMNTIFLREHNRLARLIGDAHPDWDDDRVFETARLCNIVMLLRIVLEDYIPHISAIEIPLLASAGISENQPWAQPNWMAVEFNLLYRWHGLIPNEWHLGDTTVSAGMMINNNELLFDRGIDTMVRLASRQLSGRIGLGQSPPFLQHVEQRTLKAARQARLMPFNAYRTRFGLRPYPTMDALTGDPALARTLESHYGHVDNVEFVVGLLAEHQGEDDMMGELLLTMVAHDAFTHALTNPLLSRRIFHAGTFSEVGMEEISRTTGIADVIVRNSRDLTLGEVSFNIDEVVGARAASDH